MASIWFTQQKETKRPYTLAQVSGVYTLRLKHTKNAPGVRRTLLFVQLPARWLPCRFDRSLTSFNMLEAQRDCSCPDGSWSGETSFGAGKVEC